MELNALALMLATVAMAGLGLVFWTVAAHVYPAAQVGTGSATISALTLLATLAQFNLGNVFARFLPTAGQKSRRFVLTGYAGVGLSAVLLGIGFQLLGFGNRLFAGRADRIWFPFLVAVLAVFALQDFVLIARQAARFVPLENVIFSVVKIVLLVVLAELMPGRGITVAWVLPAGLAVLIVSTMLHIRGLPHPGTPGVGAGELPDRRALGGIVAGEYLSSVVGVVVPMALPLMVLWRLGPEANAYFAMPWLIASSLNLLIWNVASSLLVEASSEPEKAQALVRRALKLALLVGAAGGLVEFAGASVILGVLGPNYASQGSDLLRVMAFVVPFNAVLVAWATLMRIQNRVGLVVVQQLVCGVAVLGVTTVLLPRLGITGAGVGYLLAQGVAGLVVAVSLVQMLRSPHEPIQVRSQA
jgi:O-antigen/teichoic acid export membrane protein